MADVFIPGVEVIEKQSFPAISGPRDSFSGMVLRTKRGPDDAVSFISNIDQFIARYGGPDSNHPYGYESAKSYFDKGGDVLYVIRAVGASAAKASKAIARIDGTSGLLTLASSSFGSWANSTFLTTTKYATQLDGAILAAATTFILDSVSGVEIGDVVYITDGSNTHIGIVTAINVGTRTITTSRHAAAAGIADNAIVTCTSTHKAKTVTSAVYSDTNPNQLQVASSATISKGDLLLVVSSGRIVELRVTEVNGTVLSVAVVYADTVTTDIAAGAIVVSTNFTVLYAVEGTTYSYPNLALESENPVTYAPSALAQSEYLRVSGSITAVATTYRSFKYPAAYTLSPLAGGLDGSAPLTTDYLGTNTGKVYQHGMKLFDQVSVLPQFGIPNASALSSSDAATVHKAATAYAENRKKTSYVFCAQLASDTYDELVDERNVTLNIQSSYGMMYAPWLNISDPLTPGATLQIPNTGDVLGVWSETAARRGTFKAPANEVVSGNVLGVTARFTDAEYGALHSVGVNLIRAISGRGIRVAGDRTLWPNEDRLRFINVRRELNAIKQGLEDFGVQLTFEPNDDLLWKRIELAGLAYLRTLHEAGWFFPRNNPDQAYFFVCDATTNTEALRQSARVRAVVGVNPVLPGELIRFELNLFDGGVVNVNEL